MSKKKGQSEFSPKQQAVDLHLFTQLLKKFNFDVSAVKGHYEVDGRKTCPDIDMEWFRRELENFVVLNEINPVNYLLPGYYFFTAFNT